mmetsp:Transcript_43038/g.64911  ORF Transcript_43038/g.64911 Transcript_43038/m.64911 type:complete len:208 (+) Transcript_43038:120-743(+)
MIPQLRQSTNHILPCCRQELCIVLGRSSCSNGARFSQAISNLPRHFSHLSKQDIANIVAEEHGLSMAKSRRILDTILDTIVENVSQKKIGKTIEFWFFFIGLCQRTTWNKSLFACPPIKLSWGVCANFACVSFDSSMMKTKFEFVYRQLCVERITEKIGKTIEFWFFFIGLCQRTTWNKSLFRAAYFDPGKTTGKVSSIQFLQRKCK